MNYQRMSASLPTSSSAAFVAVTSAGRNFAAQARVDVSLSFFYRELH
jgi:hypothetical protein